MCYPVYNVGMLQRCQPRSLAVVKARSQQMYQRQHPSLHRLSQRESSASTGQNPANVVEEVTSPLASSEPTGNVPITPPADGTALQSSAHTGQSKTEAYKVVKVAAPAPVMSDNGFAEDVIANPSSHDSFEFFYR